MVVLVAAVTTHDVSPILTKLLVMFKLSKPLPVMTILDGLAVLKEIILNMRLKSSLF